MVKSKELLMAKRFTLKILPSEDFEKLPFVSSKENPSMVFGAADPKTGVAFVRDTGFNDFTKATMEHELDELMASTSLHEEDGIRFKDFSQTLGNFGSSIPGIGGILGPALGAVGQVPDLIGSGISKVGSFFGGGSPAQPTAGGFNPGPAPRVAPITGSQSGGPNLSFQSSLPSFSGQAITPPSAAASGGIENALNLFTSGFGGGTGGGFGIPSVNVGGASFGIPSSISGPVTKATDFIKGTVGDIFQGARGAVTGGEGGDNLGTQLGKALPGVGVSLLGNLFAPKVDPIDTSGIRNRLEQQITGQGQQGPLFQEALDVGRRTLTTAPGEPPEEQFRAVDRQIDEALADNIESLRNTFKSLNPGADPENNTRFAEEVARLQRDAAQLKSEARGNAVAQQIQDQLRVMEDFLNIDRAQTQQLVQLAQMELDELVFNTGLSAQEALEFKQLFGGIGEMVLRSQFPAASTGTTA
jgi:hypothetical protein